MAVSKERAIEQIDDVLGHWSSLRTKSQHEDCSDLPQDSAKVVGLMSSVMMRLAPSGSAHRATFDLLQKKYGTMNHVLVQELPGALEALKYDYENGYLNSLTQLVHASVFADFLEMSQHLLDGGYKDPAAVLSGCVPEEHLRKLCDANSIPVDDPSGRARKADVLNADLAKANVYGKLDQKNVTAWLDLRNNAAHGKFSAYDAAQVALHIQSVRDFLSRHPA